MTAEPARLDPVREEPRVPLSDVMLAMDVVDTLRHERALVEAELDEDERRRRFIERVREIYESQGIEVTEAVVAEGVDALLADRFKYDPPARTFAVRLAEMYCERGKWALRFGVLLVVVGLVVAAYVVPNRIMRANSIRGFETRLANTGRSVESLAQRERRLEMAVERAREGGLSSIAESIVDDAAERLAVGAAALDEAAVALEPRMDPQAFLDHGKEYDGRLARVDGSLRRATEAFSAAEGRLATLDEVEGIRGDLHRLRARADGLETGEADRQLLDRLLAEAAGLVDSFDSKRARAAMQRIERELAELELDYELRIAKDGRSGVWRRHADSPNARNYYIIVTAFDADGRRVELPITSEETGARTETSTFGVRVPEAVYESVKADKLDNGLVDKSLFGRKQRGQRAPVFEFEVEDGRITDW